MTEHPIPTSAARGPSARLGLIRSTLAALALGLAGAGAAHAANLVPMFKHEAPRMNSGRPVPHLAPPRITIVGAKAALQNACGMPRPIFIARVTLHNSGGPLAARLGLASVSDTNPRTYHGRSLRLVSHGIDLPAIGAGANAVVTVPIFSLAPYAGEVGVKRLTVRVMPSGGTHGTAFARPPFYVFSATVPRGFCARAGVPHAAARRLAPRASERKAPHISFGSKAPRMPALVRPQPPAAGRSGLGQKRRLGVATAGGVVKLPPCRPLGAGASPGTRATFVAAGEAKPSGIKIAGQARAQPSARSGRGTSAPTRTRTEVQAFPMLGAVGATVPLKAVLKTRGTNKPVPNRLLGFTVGGHYVAQARTDRRGMARVKYLVPNSVGHRPIVATFVGNSVCSKSRGIAKFTAIKAATRITLTNETYGAVRRGERLDIQGMLKRTTDHGLIQGREVLIYLDGKEVSSQTDSATFYQSFPLPSNAPNRVHVKVVFKGDRLYLPSSATLTEKVHPHPIKAYLTWPDLKGAVGQIVTEKVALSKTYPYSSHSGIAGKKVIVLVCPYASCDGTPTGGESRWVGTATTDASGIARIRFKVDGTVGPHPLYAQCVNAMECDDLTLEYKSNSELDIAAATPLPVVLYVSGPTTGSVGSTLKFRVLVKRAADGTPVAGVRVHADGESASTTGQDGRTTVYYTVSPYVGSGAQNLTFHADATQHTEEGSKAISFKATPSTS